MMVDRFAYMKQHGFWSPPEDLTKKVQEIEREAFQIRKSFYKYAFFLKEDTSLLEDTMQRIDTLAVKESQVLEQALYELHGTVQHR
ncbi:hypothetical protein D3C81_2111880 [compost metagenome]